MNKSHSAAITILIPTFDRRNRLQKAVESVTQETRVPLEVHIFDNASTDDTGAYASAAADADPRIRYFRHPTNIGAKANYKSAFESVRSKYFVPLADDDWLLPDFLFDAWNILQQHDDLGAAIFVTEHKNEAGALLTTYPTALDRIGWGRRQPKEHLRDLLTYGHYGWSSVLWRTEILSFMKGNYFCAGLASDVDFQIQVFCKYPVFLANQAGAVFLAHSSQSSLGFDVRSVPFWASLVGRMDRAIRKYRLFDADEYAELRSVMLQRYRPNWRSTDNIALNPDQIIRLAALAGFRLGDWDFAFSLLARVPDETLVTKSNAAKSVSRTIRVLPRPVRDEGLKTGYPLMGSALFSSLLWLKENRAYVEGLSRKTDSLTFAQGRNPQEPDRPTEVPPGSGSRCRDTGCLAYLLRGLRRGRRLLFLGRGRGA